MRHRIYVPGLQREGEQMVGGEEFHHAARVARVREGEEVELFDGRGFAVAGRVSGIGRDELRVLIEREIASRESPLRIALAMAIIQLEKFELVLQKATELGVYSIVPLVTARVELRPERYRGKQERWEKIVLEAVKQSGRSLLPRIEEPLAFTAALARSGAKIVCEAEAEGTSAGETGECTLFIGPEGGWSDEELRAAREAGCGFLRLGPRRLRAETAGIVAVAVTAAQQGDL